MLSKEICRCRHLCHLTWLRGVGQLARLGHARPVYVINGTLTILIAGEVEEIAVYFFHINGIYGLVI